MENNLYKQIARYLNIQYPNVIYHFDLSGVNNNSRYSRVLYSQLNGSGYPDLFICKPKVSAYGPNYWGMYLEIKVDGKSPYKKNGEIKSNEHLLKQNAMLEKLAAAGYYASFGVGFDDCKKQIDYYLR